MRTSETLPQAIQISVRLNHKEAELEQYADFLKEPDFLRIANLVNDEDKRQRIKGRRALKHKRNILRWQRETEREIQELKNEKRRAIEEKRAQRRGDQTKRLSLVDDDPFKLIVHKDDGYELLCDELVEQKAGIKAYSSLSKHGSKRTHPCTATKKRATGRCAVNSWTPDDDEDSKEDFLQNIRRANHRLVGQQPTIAIILRRM